MSTFRHDYKWGDYSTSRSNVAVAVPAGEERLIGPFPKAAFNDANNKVQLTYSSHTGLTIAVLQVPKAV